MREPGATQQGMVGTVAHWRVHAYAKGAAACYPTHTDATTGAKLRLGWQSCIFFRTKQKWRFLYPVSHLERRHACWGVGPQSVTCDGLPDSLLAQAPKCKDQPHRWNRKKWSQSGALARSPPLRGRGLSGVAEFRKPQAPPLL